MQLSLSDFDCPEPPPSWLPGDKWEDMLAVSVLPGPLDSLCVHMATHSDEWKTWYKSLQPEKLPLPVREQEAGGDPEHGGYKRKKVHIESAACSCGFKNEDKIHFLLACPLYKRPRVTLLNALLHIAPFTVRK